MFRVTKVIDINEIFWPRLSDNLGKKLIVIRGHLVPSSYPDTAIVFPKSKFVKSYTIEVFAKKNVINRTINIGKTALMKDWKDVSSTIEKFG